MFPKEEGFIMNTMLLKRGNFWRIFLALFIALALELCAGAPPWAVFADEDHIIQGNVGIGTASPGGKRLKVQGDADVTGTLTAGSFSITNLGTVSVTGTMTFSGVTTDITTGANEHLALMPNGTGNVGIGTTGPATPLDILTSGTVPLSLRTSAAGDNFIKFYSTTTGNRVTIGWRQSSDAGLVIKNEDNTPIIFGTYTNPNSVRILDNGNVGIGTTAPGQKLHVYGGSVYADNYYLDGTQIEGISGRNYFKDSELSTGTGLRVGAAWSTYGIYAEAGDVVVGSNTGIIRLGQPGVGGTVYAGTYYEGGIALSSRYMPYTGINADTYVNLRVIRNNWNNDGMYIGYGRPEAVRFFSNTTEVGRFNQGNQTFDVYGGAYISGSVGIGTTVPATKLDVRGEILRSNTRISNTENYPVGRSFVDGESIFSIDPSWSQAELREFFGSNNVSWVADSTAPAGYAIQISGSVNVGGEYDSGFPYIPSENDGLYYMECWLKSIAANQSHYMGSNEYNENFSSLGGNPGSYGYWTMSNTSIGTGWTKVSGYISGFDAAAVGKFELGTKYWTPMALFNYGTGGTSYISGWKVTKVNMKGNKVFDGNVGIGTTVPGQKLQVTGIIESTSGGFKFPDGTIQGSAGAAGGWVDDGTVVRLGTSSDNVGIGTTVTGAKLDVQGGNALIGSLRLWNSDPGNVPGVYTNGSATYINSVAGDWVTTGYVRGNGLLVGGGGGTGNLNVYGQTYMAGNVGIGTTGPSGKLDVVAGAARTGTHGATPSFYVTGSLSPGQTGPSANNIEFRHDNGTQGIGFGYNTIYQTGSNTNQELNLLSRGTSPITLNAYPYSTGNVGIGIAAPNSILTVIGGDNAIRGAYGRMIQSRDEWLRINDDDQGQDYHTSGIYMDGPGVGIQAGLAVGGSNYPASGDINVNGNDIDLMAGNVGYIHRVGRISFDWTSGSYNSSEYNGIESMDYARNWADSMALNSFNDITLRLDSNNNNPNSYLRVTNDAYAGGAVVFQVDQSGNAFHTGNVGIGTTGPAAKFNLSETTGTVHGAAQGSLIVDHENSGGASSIVFRSKVNRGSDYGFIQYQDTATVGGAGEAAQLIIGTSNDADDHLILQPAGRVGIGTTSPGQKLTVVGTIETINPGGGIKFPDGSIMTSAAQAGGWTDGGANVYLTTLTDYVGIGTVSPQRALHITQGQDGGNNSIFQSAADDRPAIALRGYYPEIDIISNMYTNASHGATLRLAAYDDSNRNTWKHWVIGTPGVGASWMDIGYAQNDANPHAGIAGYAGASGTGKTIMRLQSNGNIGIGTTAPGVKLDITGSGSAENLRVQGSIKTYDGTLNGTGTWNFGAGASGDTNNFSIYHVPNGAKVVINTSGTLNATGGLQWNGQSLDSRYFPLGGTGTVAGISATNGMGMDRDSINDGLWFNDRYDQNHHLYNNYNNVDGQGGFDGMKWNTYRGLYVRTGVGGGTDRITIDQNTNYINLLNSNVGIGTTAPNTKLHIIGDKILVTPGASEGSNYPASWGKFATIGDALTDYARPAGLYGLDVAWSSDWVMLGMIDRAGSNAKDAALVWGDDAGDNLRFMFNTSTVAQLNSSGTLNATGGFQWNGQSLDSRYAYVGGSNASGTWPISITGSVSRLTTSDTRSTNPVPSSYSMGITSDFKGNGVDGLSDAGSYHGVFSFRQWSSGADWSGGGIRQIAFTDNDNLWVRGNGGGGDTWNGWKLLLNSSNISSYALPVSGGTINGNLSVTGNITVSTSNATGGGIILSDDGDFVDMNDGYATLRTSYGLRINSANRGGSNVIQLGNQSGQPIYFNTGGNVGIGTTVPAAGLHVYNKNAFFDLPGGGAVERNFTIKHVGTAQIGFGSYPGAWTPALQIQNNNNSRYVWISPLDSGSGGNARLVTGGSDFDMFPGNTLSARFMTNGTMGTNKIRADGNQSWGDNSGWWTHDPYGYGWGKPHGSFRSLEVSSSGDFSNEPAMFRIHQWGSGAAEFWKPQGTVLYLRETPGGGGGWFNRLELQASMNLTGNLGINGNQNLYLGREESFGGGDTGGADYGYIRWDNDNNSYNYWGDTGENGALVIGSSNDGRNAWSDVVALQSGAAIFLDAPETNARFIYDLDDRGYYMDPNGTSNLNYVTSRTKTRFGETGLYNTPRSDYTGNTNYWTGVMGWGKTNLNTIYSNWGSGFWDSWSNPANDPGGSSHYVGFQAMHHSYQDGTNAHGFQMAMAGEANNRFFWRSGWPSPRPWVEMIHTGNIGSYAFPWNTWINNHYFGTDGTHYATIFRDTNNGGYYVDPASGSNLNYATANDWYVNSWFRVNGGGGIYWQSYGGGWYMQDSTWVRAYNGKSIWTPATLQADANIYTPIMYDLNNSGYYVDPNGSSRLNQIYYVDNLYSVYDRPQVIYDWNDSYYFIDLNSNGDSAYFAGNIYTVSPEGSSAWVRLGAAWNKPGVYSNQSLYLGSESQVIINDNNQENWGFDGDNFWSNGWGHIYTTSSNLHIDSYSGEIYLNYYYNNWVNIGNRDTGYMYIGSTRIFDNNGWLYFDTLPNGRAYFAGNVRITGTLTVGGYIYKNGGGFQIDHPLDPANKVLVHSFVESPDMKNLYDGVVIIGEKGESIIELPDWFGALNKDFRYQLTTIGKPGMPYVKEEIKDNRFTIAGDPGAKVSWQVTGTRQDAYAEKHRLKVEEEKGTRDGMPKKGEYLTPECYGEKE